MKVLLRWLLVPPAAPLVVVAAGLWLARRHARAGRMLAIVGLALAWLLAAPLGAEALARIVEAGQRPLDAAAWATARDAASPPQAVVVLGAGIESDPSAGPGPGHERLSARSLQRAVAGARMARITGLPVMVCGGRPRQTRASEAALLRDALETELGVPVRWSEDRSRDTIENAGRAAAILQSEGVRHIVLVTHAYHMRRARAAFEAAGFTVLPAPHDPLAGQRGAPGLSDLLPSAEAAEVSSFASHEVFGTLWQGLRSLR